MATLIGDLQYPGLTAFNDASATISQGISPSRITVSVPPSFGTIAEVGDMVFTDGRGSITFRDCKVEDLQGTADIQRQGGTLVFLDHRWRWEFPVVSMRANIPVERLNTVPLAPQPGNATGNPDREPVPDPRGTEPIDPRTKVTARNLARLCLRAMGESSFDVDAIPANYYPTVDWDATNAAQALQQLAESLGCRVVYQPVANRVVIAKQGVGKQLPDGPKLAESPSITVKARPSRVRLLYGRTRYQMRFKLGAVGMDFDGSWRWVDDLSYRPSGGFERFGYTLTKAAFDGAGLSLPGSRTTADAAALADKFLYSAYRIRPVSVQGGGRLLIPPFDEIAANAARSSPLPFGFERSGREARPGNSRAKRIDQVRLLGTLNQVTIDDMGRTVRAAAKCYGKHVPPERMKVDTTWVTTFAETTDVTPVNVPFEIDEKHQLVLFTRKIFALDGSQVAFPELVLETACEVTDNDTNQYIRHAHELVIPGGLDTAPATILKEDLWIEHTSLYKSNSHVYFHSRTNSDQLKPKAEFYLRGEAQKYQADEAADRAYAGVVPIDPDGAIQQVTWTTGPAPTTRASRNTEHNLYIPSYEGRRRLENTGLDNYQRIQEGAKEAFQ